jgi:hypothetical protein
MDKEIKWFMNTNPEFGHPGPYISTSEEALLEEMRPTFVMWSRDSQDPESAIQKLNNNFLKGLELI